MWRHALTVTALVLLSIVLGWTPTPPAGAHGQLVSSQPAADGVVEVMPSRAFLTFSSPVREVKEIAVVGPDGSVTNGTATANGAEVTQTLWAGPDGTYTMTYFVVSEDGHDVRGDLHFEVGPLSVAAPEPDPGTTPAPARSSDEPEDEGPGIAFPAAVLLLGAGVAMLLLLVRRRST